VAAFPLPGAEQILGAITQRWTRLGFPAPTGPDLDRDLESYPVHVDVPLLFSFDGGATFEKAPPLLQARWPESADVRPDLDQFLTLTSRLGGLPRKFPPNRFATARWVKEASRNLESFQKELKEQTEGFKTNPNEHNIGLPAVGSGSFLLGGRMQFYLLELSGAKRPALTRYSVQEGRLVAYRGHGVLTSTKRITLPASIFVNFSPLSPSEPSCLRAALLDDHAMPVQPFTFENSVEVCSNVTRHELVWRGAQTGTPPKRATVAISISDTALFYGFEACAV
jgi:hypothetical protein